MPVRTRSQTATNNDAPTATNHQYSTWSMVTATVTEHVFDATPGFYVTFTRPDADTSVQPEVGFVNFYNAVCPTHRQQHIDNKTMPVKFAIGKQFMAQIAKISKTNGQIAYQLIPYGSLSRKLAERYYKS